MGVSELSEHTKRAFDFGAFVLAGLSASTIMSALNMIAVAVSIIAGLTSTAWYVYRFIAARKYGPPTGN